VAAAEWRAGRQLAEVMVPRGKLLNEMGFTQAGRVWLHAEEALFLVESSRLLLLHQGRTLALQEVHAAMVRTPLCESTLMSQHQLHHVDESTPTAPHCL
jgi:hypothetical protein